MCFSSFLNKTFNRRKSYGNLYIGPADWTFRESPRNQNDRYREMSGIDIYYILKQNSNDDHFFPDDRIRND